MSEVEKLYKKAKIEPEINYVCDKEPCKKSSLKCCADIGCSHLYDIREDYPDFTAEKQLLLIQWLAKTRPIHISFLIDKWVLEDIVRYGKRYDTFNDALAGYVNQIWQYLTEQEQKQIRSILKG